MCYLRASRAPFSHLWYRSGVMELSARIEGSGAWTCVPLMKSTG